MGTELMTDLDVNVSRNWTQWIDLSDQYKERVLEKPLQPAYQSLRNSGHPGEHYISGRDNWPLRPLTGEAVKEIEALGKTNMRDHP